jgi:hypothetical protein
MSDKLAKEKIIALGKKFGRSATSEEKAEWLAIKDKQARLDYKERWNVAREGCKNIKLTLSRSDVKTKYDVKDSLYMPFSMVVKAEGGQIALEGATAAARRI